MEINIRQMKIKNRQDYLFNDNILANIKDFDSSLLKIHKLSHKEVFSLNIYYMKYIPTKTLDHIDDYLYLFLDDADGYIEENNGIKCLVFTPTEKNKETLKNYEKRSEETKRQIEVIDDDKPFEYRKDFMKIKFESNNDSSLGKTFNLLDMIIVVASVLEKKCKYYPQIILHESAYKL